jgi:hypothetical protein
MPSQNIFNELPNRPGNSDINAQQGQGLCVQPLLFLITAPAAFPFLHSLYSSKELQEIMSSLDSSPGRIERSSSPAM